LQVGTPRTLFFNGRVERDHAQLVEAIEVGKVDSEPG